MNPIFYYSNFLVSKLSKGVVSFVIFEKDFHCRIWEYQLDRIKDFITNGTGGLFFGEEVYDVDCRYNDICIIQLSDAEYKIVCVDAENGREDFVHEYILQAADFGIMMGAIIEALEEDLVDKV